MKFLHLSDIHFLREYPKAEKGYNAIFNSMTSPLIQMKKALEKINLSEIDFVIITGDLVESGTYEDYELLKNELEGLLNNIPYIITLGNHDNKEAFYKGWFNKRCNLPYNTVNKINGLRIISFDNSQYKNSDGFISENQYTWLKNQLKNRDEGDTILISHHHLIKSQFTTPAVSYNDDFEIIIKDSSIVGIFVGHTHHPFKGDFAGKPYFTAGSLSFIGYDESNGIVRFEESSKINLCTYEDGKISVEVISALANNKELGIVNFRE